MLQRRAGARCCPPPRLGVCAVCARDCAVCVCVARIYTDIWRAFLCNTRDNTFAIKKYIKYRLHVLCQWQCARDSHSTFEPPRSQLYQPDTFPFSDDLTLLPSALMRRSAAAWAWVGKRPGLRARNTVDANQQAGRAPGGPWRTRNRCLGGRGLPDKLLWPRLAEAGGWPRLAEAGRGWPRQEAGRGWPRLAEAGRGRRLAEAEGWPRLAEAGRGWPRREAALSMEAAAQAGGWRPP